MVWPVNSHSSWQWNRFDAIQTGHNRIEQNNKHPCACNNTCCIMSVYGTSYLFVNLFVRSFFSFFHLYQWTLALFVQLHSIFKLLLHWIVTERPSWAEFVLPTSFIILIECLLFITGDGLVNLLMYIYATFSFAKKKNEQNVKRKRYPSHCRHFGSL